MPLSLVSRRDRSEPVLIVDLDGTLLRVNSFPRWAMFLARGRFAHLNWHSRARIAVSSLTLIAGRKLRLMPHEALKQRLRLLWRAATSGDLGAAQQDFNRQLRLHVRPEFAPLLKSVADGDADAILATAAAGEYAEGLGRALGFRHVLASAGGADKKDAVLRLLSERGWQDRRRVLYTDHVDDLPLMQICDETIWFGSDAARLRIALATPQIVFRQRPDET